LVQSKSELYRKDLFAFDDAIYLNYPFSEAVKVIPFFENLSVRERNRMTKFIHDIYGFKVRSEDLFGKLVVSLFCNFEKCDLIFVGLTGLGENSIGTLIDLLKKSVEREKDKVVILTKSSIHQSDQVSVIAL
jgi:hypothetical protein